MESTLPFKRAALPAAVLAGLLTSGCASPVLQSKATSEAAAPGLVYALPKAQILLQASRRKVDAPEVEAARKDADDAAAASKAAAAGAKDAAQQLKALEAEVAKAEELKVGADALSDARRRRDIAKVLSALAKTKADSAAEVAKKAADAFELVRGQVGKWVESGSLTPQAHAPDATRRFVATHTAHALRDDVVTLNVVDGMLSTTESKATGQGANVVLNLVRSLAAINLGTGTSLPRSTFSLLERAPGVRLPAAQIDCKAYDLAFVFDPTDAASWKAVQDRLAQSGSFLQLKDIGNPAEVTSLPPDRHVSAVPSEPVDGLFYRVPRRVNLELSPKSPQGAPGNAACVPDGAAAPARLTATVPDASTLFVLPVMGATMSKSSVKHVFKDGMLAELTLDQPSTLAAVAGLPVDILKALVSVPAEIVKLRVDYSSQEKAELDNQVKLIEAQIALLKAQRDLEAAREAGKP